MVSSATGTPFTSLEAAGKSHSLLDIWWQLLQVPEGELEDMDIDDIDRDGEGSSDGTAGSGDSKSGSDNESDRSD